MEAYFPKEVTILEENLNSGIVLCLSGGDPLGLIRLRIRIAMHLSKTPHRKSNKNSLYRALNFRLTLKLFARHRET